LCSVPSPSGCLRATSECLFLGTRGAAVDESGGDSVVRYRGMTTIEQAVCTGVRNVRACTRISLRPIPQWSALEGCTAVALMAEHDDARQASRQCARACGALTRVRRACLLRTHQAFPVTAISIHFSELAETGSRQVIQASNPYLNKSFKFGDEARG